MSKIKKSLKTLLCFCLIINLSALNIIHINAIEANTYHGKRLDYKKTTPVDFKIYNVYWKEIKNGLKFINPGQFDIKWRYATRNESVLVEDADGTTYFIDMVGTLFAVDSNGEKIWSRKLESSGDVALSLDGTVYTLCEIETSNTRDPDRSIVQGFDKHGNEICSYVVKNTTPSHVITTFAGDEKGNLIISTDDGICSYDKNGKLKWMNKDIVKMTYYASSGKFSNVYNVKVLSSENIIIITDKKIYSLNSKGKVRWSIDSLDIDIDITSNDLGYIYDKVGKNSKIIDSKNGRILASGETTKLNPQDFPSRTSWSGGYYCWNTIVKNEEDKNFNKGRGIVSYDNNNRVKWTYNVPKGCKGHVIDIVADPKGNVYFSDEGGNLYSLDKNGNERYMLIRNSYSYSYSKLMLTKKGDVVWSSHEIGVLCLGNSSIRVLIDNEEVNFNNNLLQENGTTLVPFRPVFEKLGLTINWDPDTQTISGSNNDLNITMKIGSDLCYVNGTEKQLTIAPKIYNGSTYIPLRFISEITQKEVRWDEKNKTVFIGSAEQQIEHVINQFFSYIQKKDIKGILSLINSDKNIYKEYNSNLDNDLLINSFTYDDIEVKINVISDSKASAKISYNLTTTEGFEVFSKGRVNVGFTLDKKPGGSWRISSTSQAIFKQ